MVGVRVRGWSIDGDSLVTKNQADGRCTFMRQTGEPLLLYYDGRPPDTVLPLQHALQNHGLAPFHRRRRRAYVSVCSVHTHTHTYTNVSMTLAYNVTRACVCERFFYFLFSFFNRRRFACEPPPPLSSSPRRPVSWRRSALRRRRSLPLRGVTSSFAPTEIVFFFFFIRDARCSRHFFFCIRGKWFLYAPPVRVERSRNHSASAVARGYVVRAVGRYRQKGSC